MEKIYTACLVIFLCLEAKSQYYFFNDKWYDSEICWEAGVSAGGINCLTDLGGSSGTGRKFISDVNWNATKVAGTIFTAFNYRNYLVARAELFFGEVNAADSILKNKGSGAQGRYVRNLHFRSPIIEKLAMVEIHPLMLGNYWTDKVSSAISPFITAGFGYFSFNPQARLGNTWINLPALHTEGQGLAAYPGSSAYKLKQCNVPLGIGVRYQPSPIINGRFEIIYRKLWTDYLDDVSTTYIDPAHFHNHFSPQMARLAHRLADRSIASSRHMNEPGAIRGNPKNNDTYFSAMLKLSVVLGRQKRP